MRSIFMPLTFLIWTVTPVKSKAYHRGWPAVNGWASNALQSMENQIRAHKKRPFWGIYFMKTIFLVKRWIYLIWGPSICILWSVNFFVTSWDRSGTTSWNLVITILQGTSVAIITVKTSAEEYAESLARVVLDLCGSEGGCCQTSTDGRGLDNPGEDRRKGQTDVYTATSILGNCAEQVVC